MGLLLYRMRPELATLRSMSGQLPESGAAAPAEQATSAEPAAKELGASGIRRPEAESSMLDMTVEFPAIRERVSRQRRFEDTMAAAGSVWLPVYQDSTGPLPIYRDMTGMPPPSAYPIYQDSTQPLPTYRDMTGMSTTSRYHPTGSTQHLAIGRHRRPEWIGEPGGDAQAGYLQKEHRSSDAADPPDENRSLARGERGSGYDR